MNQPTLKTALGVFTPEDVVAAYKKTGLQPSCVTFLQGNSACAIGVLAAAHAPYRVGLYHTPSHILCYILGLEDEQEKEISGGFCGRQIGDEFTAFGYACHVAVAEWLGHSRF